MYYRRYEKASEASVAGLVQECFELFKSEPVFKLLTTFTGLKLSNVDIHENDEKNDEQNDENTAKTSTEDQVTVYKKIVSRDKSYYHIILKFFSKKIYWISS